MCPIALQIAHRVAPEARVVYIDVDPVVSTHASALMVEHPAHIPQPR
ncbi:MAG TPA: SAM-dependent methyltransferase [Trebonia sp.]